MSPRSKLDALLREVRACTLCAEHLPLGPRPVVQIAPGARVMLIGQAPGTRVHATGIPFNDPSGDRLRAWLGLSRETFYDSRRLAIMPMGFCYPGKGKGGDLPPRPECAPQWHARLRVVAPEVRLTLLVGSYAIAYYLGERRGKTLGDTVRRWRDYAPEFLPMPHPSPRNIRWFAKNPWWEAEMVPEYRRRVQTALAEA